MRNVTISFFLSLLFLSLSGCDFTDNKLKVWNNTKDSIAFIIPTEPDYFPTTDSFKGLSKSENDSLLNTRARYDPNDESPFGGVHFLAADSSKNLMTFNTAWEEVMDVNRNKKLEIYFFPAFVLTSGNYTWKEIKNLFTGFGSSRYLMRAY